MDRAEKTGQFQHVTWEEIEDWAGAAIAKRGQSYYRNGRVNDLAATDDGAVLAWVQGTARYATLVDYDDGGLVAACTCPYGGTCKHAVAVLLAYRSAVAQRRELATAPGDDQRLLLLEAAADQWDADGWDNDGAGRASAAGDRYGAS